MSSERREELADEVKRAAEIMQGLHVGGHPSPLGSSLEEAAALLLEPDVPGWSTEQVQSLIDLKKNAKKFEFKPGPKVAPDNRLLIGTVTAERREQEEGG